MRLRWRPPLVLSACVVVAQLFSAAPLVDVVGWTTPASVRITYPASHVLFAPVTLLADWLNGGSRRDLIGFALWALVGYAVLRLAARRTAAPGRARRETLWALAFLVALAAFCGWGYWLPRPIPRLVPASADELVMDVHSHTALSHDGRPGFGAGRNAAWHARAGFDVAFVTDHNAFGAAREWRTGVPRGLPRLLDGEEISLSGIHVLALGNSTLIDNRPYDASWDSTGALIRRLHGDSVFLVPTLPEDWRHHTGAEFGQLSEWGVDGFEIWTSAPQAMELPPSGRRTVISWSRLENRPMFGSTDMHGYGNAATVWNVVWLPGWRALGDAALQRAILTRLRTGGAAANQIVALRRWLPQTRLESAISVPVNLGLLLRTASRPHALALLGWIWAVAAALSLRTNPRRA
ncbi:MAG TPA: hypothetical protein VMF70_03925 [Gemmatimonadales bacterium]|nr:hypothetical protein [Gemmatimonadales bacterium]